MTEPETYPTADGGRITGHIPTRYQDADHDGHPDIRDGITPDDARTLLERIPRWARGALYIGYALTGPILIYLTAKHLIGTDEWILYAGVGSVFGITAAGNTKR